MILGGVDGRRMRVGGWMVLRVWQEGGANFRALNLRIKISRK